MSATLTFNGRAGFARLIARVLVVVMAASIAADGARAGQPDRSEAAIAAGFAGPVQAFQFGLQALNDGRFAEAIPALEAAAEDNVFGAQVYLARIFDRGPIEWRNELRAFQLYTAIAEQNYFAKKRDNQDILIAHPGYRFVAEAIVSLGRYYRQGVPAISLLRNEAKAQMLFRTAALELGDAEGGYELGRGLAESRNAGVRAAGLKLVRNAAFRGIGIAQAYWGGLLLDGQLVPQDRIKGLAWLITAIDYVDYDRAPEVYAAYDAAHADATADERALAFDQSRVFRPKIRPINHPHMVPVWRKPELRPETLPSSDLPPSDLPAALPDRSGRQPPEDAAIAQDGAVPHDAIAAARQGGSAAAFSGADAAGGGIGGMGAGGNPSGRGIGLDAVPLGRGLLPEPQIGTVPSQ